MHLEIHSAAKETVALAEERFMSNSHEWQFDQAWQDMLNHATLKVNVLYSVYHASLNFKQTHKCIKMCTLIINCITEKNTICKLLYYLQIFLLVFFRHQLGNGS